MAHTEKLGRILKRVSHALELCTTLSPVSSPVRAAKRQRVIQDFSRRADRCLNQLETDLDLSSREQQDPEQEDEEDEQQRLYEFAIQEQEENERRRQEAEQTQLELDQAHELEELEHRQEQYLQSRLQLHQPDQEVQHPHMRPSKPPDDPMANEAYSNLANYALNPNNRPTSQTSLFKYLVKVPPSSTKKDDLLQTALKKLILGYNTEPAVDWNALVLPYTEVLDQWGNQCAAFLENDQNPDLQERILAREKHIQIMPLTSRALSFVHYVIRTVETLKFTIEWETRDQAWKTTYLTALFNQRQATELTDATLAELKKARKRFAVDHSKLMSVRSNLLMLYHAFGVNVLLDPFWDIALKPSPHKPAVVQLLTLLAAHPPSRAIRRNSQIEDATAEEEEWNIDERACNLASMEPGSVTIVGLLDALSGDEVVSDYVESFMNKFPPTFISL